MRGLHNVGSYSNNGSTVGLFDDGGLYYKDSYDDGGQYTNNFYDNVRSAVKGSHNVRSDV